MGETRTAQIEDFKFLSKIFSLNVPKYFDEKELVDLRVRYLNSIVDYFIVVEANITHQGKKKDWN